VQGGAVLYDQVTAYDVYTDRDVERVEPGSESPIVTGQRSAPLVAQVEKFGGKFPVTYEARRRNNISRVNNHMRRLSNTIVRKMHQRGLAELAAAVSANSRTAASAATWASSLAVTSSAMTAAARPLRSIYGALREAENNELGYSYDTLIANPNDVESLRAFYGDTLDSALQDFGIRGPDLDSAEGVRVGVRARRRAGRRDAARGAAAHDDRGRAAVGSVDGRAASGCSRS
jgi:hypothetical protein